MQLAQLAIVTRPAGSFPDAFTFSYGMGLFVEEDPVFGTVVQHSGGYPGYGSQMRWHPPTGLGVVVLGNGTYAPAGQLAAKLLAELLRQAGAAPAGTGTGAVRGPAPGDGRPWAQTADRARRRRPAAAPLGRRAGRPACSRPNVAWDQPLADRRAVIAGSGTGSATSARPRPARRSSTRPRTAGGGCAASGHRAGRDRARTAVVSRWSSRCGWPSRPAPGSVLLRLLDALIGISTTARRSGRTGCRWPTTWTRPSWPGGSGWPPPGRAAARRAPTGPATASPPDRGAGGAAGRAVLAIAVDHETEVLRQAEVTLLP